MMTNKKIKIFLLTSITIMISCKPAINVRNSNSRSGIMRVRQFTDKKTTLMWAHHDPTQRQTLMYVDENGNIKILAEQSPDAGLSKNLDLIPKAKTVGNIEPELAIKISSELDKLTIRTTSLMMTREALYRLAEMYFNGAIDQNKYELLFKDIISQTKGLIIEEAKLEEQKAKTIMAEVEKLKLEIEKEKLKEMPVSEKEKDKKTGTKSENTNKNGNNN